MDKLSFDDQAHTQRRIASGDMLMRSAQQLIVTMRNLGHLSDASGRIVLHFHEDTAGDIEVFNRVHNARKHNRLKAGGKDDGR
jgi:hypothetical protein